MPFFAIMECHSRTQSCSTFAIKYFWQIVNMIFNFAKLVVVVLSCYVFALAMDSFINMPYCCRYASFVMHCFVMSASSSQRCLHITVSVMLCFLLTKLAMFTWLPSYLLVVFGLWTVRDFYHMHLVEYFQALFGHVKFL